MTEQGERPGAGKRKVRITIDSSGDNGHVHLKAEGELFPKGRQCYIRYTEPEEAQMGQTVTTVKLEPGRLRIIRHGDVHSEQTFDPAARFTGFLNLPQGRMELEVDTELVRLNGDWTTGAVDISVKWSYRLKVMGQEAGRFDIVLTAVAAD